MSDQSLLAEFTIMIPPLPPDRIEEARYELQEKIKEKGIEETIAEMVDYYFSWEDDPDPASALRKKRTMLIFSRKELEVLVPKEIHKILDDVRVFT